MVALVDVRSVEEHRTGKYKYDGLVVRRGYPFTIILASSLNVRDMSVTKVVLEIGKQLKKKKLTIEASRDFDRWRYQHVTNSTPGSCKIELFPPSYAAVGLYKVTAYDGRHEVGRSSFFLTFNPWNKDDDVYMHDENARKEYVLKGSTKIYVGSEHSISSVNWNLDQFNSEAVTATNNMINLLSYEDRKSPVLVSRLFSALINSNDDNGVLVGNWTGKYEDGYSPLFWMSSGDILSKYVSDKSPVKYGQCWVFSGVLCTVLRTIGIPTRCITNFASLHDTDASLNWEIYLDENLDVINRRGDSCWNFHCWNESWMKRPDLGSAHDGWQVLDATPQERSKGIFRLGPASKYAIKEACVTCPYDVGFVFAEVNANKIFFKKQPDGTFKEYMVKKNTVGKNISTKKIGSDEREDITHEYKVSEKPTVSEVSRDVVSATEPETTRVPNINIKIALPCTVCLSQDLSGRVVITGMSHSKNSTVKVELFLITYYGRDICKLLETTEVCIESDKTINLNVTKERLSDAVTVEFPYVRCKISVFDDNNDEYAVEEMTVSVKTPDIEILGLQKVYPVSTPVSFQVYLKNHLCKQLNDLFLRISFSDGPPQVIKIGTLAPGEVCVRDVVVVPKSAGSKKILVAQVSNECCGFTNIGKFTVVDSNA